MSLAESMLAEFTQEIAATKKCLERVPADKFDWKPHPKSMSAGQLALHIATAPGAIVQLAAKDVAEVSRTPLPQPSTVDEILKAFDQSVAKVKETLPGFDDARMSADWKLSVEGKVILSVPRAGMLRTILLNHLYHHRGQLTVYLRMLGAAVPSVYGPSADEQPDFARS
jgi:uncharacterized damage-inducible protein DinB